MDTCPHCQFLVREEARTCDVCHKPLFEASGVPSFASGQTTGQDIMAARVGPAETSFPVSIVWLFVLALLLAVGVWLSSTHWL